MAAWISRGIPLHEFGPILPNPVQIEIPPLEKVQDGQLRGCILSVDHFGNLITNLKPEDFSRSAKIRAGRKEVTVFRKTYGEGKKGEIFIVPGSTGYLEIVVREGSAASLLNLKSGDPIMVTLS